MRVTSYGYATEHAACSQLYICASTAAKSMLTIGVFCTNIPRAAMPQPQVKGNVYKNKRVLMDAVHKQKAEKVREKTIADQFEARRAKGKASRERKAARREERLAAVRGVLCTRTCKR